MTLAETVIDLPWIVAVVLLPLAGAILCFLWPARAALVGQTTVFTLPVSIIGLGTQLTENGVVRHNVGGWGAPLGIDLYVDGLSLTMLVATTVVAAGITLYSASFFPSRQSSRFWPLWLFLLAALNAVFLSRDIFNLYVALELLGLTAVALTALPGDRDALVGAMRYLLATLLGSLLYLFGVVLTYHELGGLDLSVLATNTESSPVAWAALGAMTAGLALKTALFPLHFWLPPAHASAPAPVSAALSALVVKASFYVLLRLWLELFPNPGPAIGQLLGLLGALAILIGATQALRAERLKRLIAYSTVSQLGYLFLGFPAAIATAWSGALYLVLAHALAKAAMFLAAGNLIFLAGHDRIAGLSLIAQRTPLTLAAFGLAGVSVIGLPPSGGFVAKWLLLEGAFASGQWWWAVIIVVGGILSAAYVFGVLGQFFAPVGERAKGERVPLGMEWGALALALGAILLGFLAPPVLSLGAVGDPFGAGGPLP